MCPIFLPKCVKFSGEQEKTKNASKRHLTSSNLNKKNGILTGKK
jgi:hypothetical protein